MRLSKRAIPTVFSFIASAGVIGTAISASNDTIKAVRLLEKKKTDEPMSKTEIVKACFPCYIPTIGFTFGTIMCILGANHLNRKQQASLASAYALLNRSYHQYMVKNIETNGEEAHDRVVEAIKADPPLTWATGATGGGSLDISESNVSEKTRLFYDRYSGRIFESTLSKVIEAEYHLNRNFNLMGGEIDLNDFYEFLGLDPIECENHFGWSVEDELYWIDFNHTIEILDDGLEYCVIDFVFDPRDLNELNEW